MNTATPLSEKQQETFVRNPPQALEINTRIAIQSMGHAFDVIEILMSRLFDMAREVAQRPTHQRLDAGVAPFSDVWSVVDHSFTIAQLLKFLQQYGFDGPILKEFSTRHNSVFLLRNKMDHLAANIKNLGNIKEMLPPIFGALTFVVWDNGEGDIPKKCRIFTLSSGPVIQNGKSDLSMPFSNPLSKAFVDVPIGCFELHAFGISLDISELYKDLMNIRDKINTNVASEIRQQITKQAISEGLDPSQSLAGVGRGFSAVALFEIE